MEEEYFLSVKEIPKHLMSYHRFSKAERYSFKLEIYKWCLKYKIHYKTKKCKPFGFIFKNKEEAMVVKLKWW